MAVTQLSCPGWSWHSTEEYRKTVSRAELSLSKFHEVTDLLLSNPNLNSSHLFRADILSDSAGKLKTKSERTQQLHGATTPSEAQSREHTAIDGGFAHDSLEVNRVPPYRTVVRELIPRNQNLDRPLQQTCYFYALQNGAEAVLYVPQVDNANQIPWYHPKVRALAYFYESIAESDQSAVSVHISFFDNGSDQPIPDRLHRTVLSLLNTFLRLARYDPASKAPRAASNGASDDTDLDLRPSALKDTILPQHAVQDTYARLKTAYAAKLIAAWVEATPPEKHVFEDLAIAAFLVCLWEYMYISPTNFPGFVDMACGNGLLVHILNQEGWRGIGLDARRRKTWDSLGLGESVQEKIIVPQPFRDKSKASTANQANGSTQSEDDNTSDFHNGMFPPGTFLISNHADELTIWTPLLAALSNPSDPLPFLNIPCCSHALSGDKHRYSPKEARLDAVNTPSTTFNDDTSNDTFNKDLSADQINNTEPQPATGSLAALRAEKARTTSGTEDKSMYACLTRKAVQISRQLGIDAKCTLMRIPSTRNIGIISLGQAVPPSSTDGVIPVANEDSQGESSSQSNWRRQRAASIIERECTRSGGVQRSAEAWIERARKLHAAGGGGGSRGKLNLGGPQNKA